MPNAIPHHLSQNNHDSVLAEQKFWHWWFKGLDRKQWKPFSETDFRKGTSTKDSSDLAWEEGRFEEGEVVQY